MFKAIRTGKFPYSYGRKISLNNAIFVVNCYVFKVGGFFDMEKALKLKDVKLSYHLNMLLRMS